jgi:hypothetical protein
MNGFRDSYFSSDSFFSLLLVVAPKEWQRALSAYQTALGASFAYVSQCRAETSTKAPKHKLSKAPEPVHTNVSMPEIYFGYV